MQTPFSYQILRDAITDTDAKPKVILMNLSFYLLGGREWMEKIYLHYYKLPLVDMVALAANGVIDPQHVIQWTLTNRLASLRYRQRSQDLADQWAKSPEDFPEIMRAVEENRYDTSFAANNGYHNRGTDSIAGEHLEETIYTTGFE
jgi:hypothetical protein